MIRLNSGSTLFTMIVTNNHWKNKQIVTNKLLKRTV